MFQANPSRNSEDTTKNHWLMKSRSKWHICPIKLFYNEVTLYPKFHANLSISSEDMKQNHLTGQVGQINSNDLSTYHSC